MDIQRMEPFALQEISRRSIVINKIIGGCVQWGNSPLAVLTDRGISIFDYTYKISSSQKKLAVVEFCVPCTKTSPALELFPARLTKHFISSLNHNQMLIDPALWPHNPELMKELATVTSFQWSPPQLQHNNMSILAVVTNLGHIELYGHQRYGWNSILSISELIKQSYNLQAPLERIDQSIANLEALKKLALTLETSTVCWSLCIDEATQCYFVTAQKNGDLLFWRITSDNVSLKVVLVLLYTVKVGELISLNWIPLSDKRFLLMYSNLLGQLFGLECEIENEEIITKKTVCVWVYKDRMVVNHLNYMSNNGKLVIIYAKHRNLVVQMLTESFTVLYQCQKNINQSKIASVTQDNNNLYVCTVNGKIYKIILTLSENKLDMEFSLIRTKDSYETSELHGFGVSNNSVIWALSLCDRKLTYRKDQKYDIVFLVAEDKKPELLKLLNNPTNSFQHMWDCLEMLRYKAIKSKTLPEINYDQLYAEASTDIYKLKLYLKLLCIYKSEEVMAITCKIKLPESSVEKVKETVLLKHAQIMIGTSPKYEISDGMVKECFTFANKYIKYYCQKYKCRIEDKESSNMNYPEQEHRCESCDEVMDHGFVCRHGHMNMFCTVTFTPIVSDDYVYCKGCDAIARIELYPNNVTCVFCDIPLDKFD